MDEKELEAQKRINIKNKAIYFICTIAMLSTLVYVFYFFFYQTINIDLTQNLIITYDGESTYASVNVENNNLNYNQRIQPFYDSLSYTIEPNYNLANGDILIVTVNYDEKLADSFNINVTSNTKEIEVSNLVERYKVVSDISKDYLASVESKGLEYIERNKETIMMGDFNELDTTKNIEFGEIEKLHTIFLKAEKKDDKDKLIEMYTMKAIGTSLLDDEQLESSITYMIIYDQVNTDMNLQDDNIYGEKVKSNEDMNVSESAIGYLKSKYLLNYDIQIIEQEKKP